MSPAPHCTFGRGKLAGLITILSQCRQWLAGRDNCRAEEQARIPACVWLGVTALWVSPIFRQVAFEPSYHGYGIQNFLDVDPHFGTRAEFSLSSRPPTSKGFTCGRRRNRRGSKLRNWPMPRPRTTGLASLAAQAGSSKAQSNELLALRARKAMLGSRTNELPTLRKENRRLQATQDRPTAEPTAEQQQAVQTRMNYGKSAIMSCMMQTRTNQGLFPSDFGQVTASLPEQMKSEADPTGDAFELLYHGAFKTLTTMSNPQDIIVIRQKQPTQYGNRWAKVYVCADGHCEVHTQADSDFAAWESQHAIPQQPGGQ